MVGVGEAKPFVSRALQGTTLEEISFFFLNHVMGISGRNHVPSQKLVENSLPVVQSLAVAPSTSLPLCR